MTVATVERTELSDEQALMLARSVQALLKQREAPTREKHFAPVRRYMKQMRETIARDTGFDPGRINWSDPSFSAKQLRYAVEKTTRRRGLREANAETSFGQLLRYGVQHFLFDAYQQVETVMESVYEARPSSNRQEWYAPLYGAEVPEDVDAGGKFDDSRIRGLDVVVVNKKVGRILSIERELVDDDQTGQIVQRASRLGERMRYKEELDAVLEIVNARDYSTGAAATGYTSTIGNNGTGQGLSMRELELADIALTTMKDPLGNFFLVVPDTVLVGPANKINLYKLLNSAYQPAIPGASGETAATAASGATGWTLTANWLQGRYTPVVSVFLAHQLILGTDYWFLMQAKKGAVIQNRDPLEVVQENPLSGQAFEFDSYRYRVRRRYRHRVIEPRFIYQGKGAQ